ncbi:23S rRNA (adenine(2030)-N(6))-methyltransferase RlmJ [Hyphomonas sp.]|uniref:23S rRNA (adenine(2030)-N(6))-methyltransferase RlmJ n=1 Tax=Hyphomonas sp. TaxID=87 RepID=UPI001BCF45B4|nr:23S rRNA (adenine(2030)-N(6))-methyltransferase RlmJ [Hyphomonas sp.]
MLSYQHGFHAGNRADVLKHGVLDTLLKAAAAGPRPLFYVETHSGRGRYDLTNAQARKRGESDDGVIALMKGKAPSPLSGWMDLVNARGMKDYPGSPALAQALLPKSARMVLFELHPQENAALTEAMRGDDRIRIQKADGYTGALKLAPRGGEQLVVLVDPSYETQRDIEALALWTPKALKRWPGALLILWLPLFRDGREAEFGEYLATLGDAMIFGARWPVATGTESSIEGSAMVAFGAPPEARAPCEAIATSLENYWAQKA